MYKQRIKELFMSISICLPDLYDVIAAIDNMTMNANVLSGLKLTLPILTLELQSSTNVYNVKTENAILEIPNIRDNKVALNLIKRVYSENNESKLGSTKVTIVGLRVSETYQEVKYLEIATDFVLPYGGIKSNQSTSIFADIVFYDRGMRLEFNRSIGNNESVYQTIISKSTI
jgi:hypothetical protein